MKNKSGKWFAFILYPENNLHCDILNYILDAGYQERQGFKVVGMMHDRSIYTTGTKTGQHKKTHIHIMMKTESPHTVTAIAKMLGGSRPVLRLYQRDYMSEHSTDIDMVKDENGGDVFARYFEDSTGKEFPVLVDDGAELKSTVDLDIPPEVWTILESSQHWDSLPAQFYGRPDYPQFRCAENQYWKLAQKQDITHVEAISDPKAYYLYLQHRDMASVRAGKEQYSKSEFFGTAELLDFLNAPNTLQYQLQTLLNVFFANNITNGKQALDFLSYEPHMSELLEFYWKNISKFNTYFRGLEQEMQERFTQDSEPEIDYTHKARREKDEYYQEKATRKARDLRKEAETLIAEGKKNGFEKVKERLETVARWFSCHPEQSLYVYPTPEDKKTSKALEESFEKFHVEHDDEKEISSEVFSEPTAIQDFFGNTMEMLSLEDYQNIV